MANITHESPVVTEDKLKDFYEDIKPFLGCPAYLTSEGNVEYYSTDEKVIGRWINNKPLYQKTYTFDSTTFPNADGNISLVANIDEIIDYKLVCHDGKYNTGYIPTNLSHQKLWQSDIPFDNSNGLFSIINYTTNPYSIQISGQGFYDWGSVDKAHLIVKYTKTTDSAATTIQEDPNEYSTTEKIVGKWIDGKPIYQKTINFGTLGNATKKAVAHNISNLKAVVSFKASAWGTTGGVYYAFLIPNVGTNNQYTYDISIDITGANIDITTQTDRTWLTAQVTLQYTKTTD